MKKLGIFVIVLFLAFSVKGQTPIFNDLLQKHVDKKGNVDYKSFKEDLPKLQKYIHFLNQTSPEQSWSVNKEKAFWINAYNANTILLILQEYPVKSIMDIKIKGNTAWKNPFVTIGGKTYTLDYIEHEILRKKFTDPRIHVGVNCASISCPKLLNVDFTEDNIDNELEQLMTEFINHNSRNKISENKVQISSIFNWFKEDFTKNGSIINYLNNYSTIKINKKAEISYLKYDWSLNEK